MIVLSRIKTYINANGRPSLLKQCSNTLTIGEILSLQNETDNYDYNKVPIGANKLGKSVEDKLFLDIMDKEM